MCIFDHLNLINHKTLTMTVVKTISTFLLLGVIATSCGDKKKSESTEMTDTTAVAMDTTVVVETPNIVGVAAGNEDFSTLVDTLLKPENLEKLKSVLTYHVVAGKFDAAAVTDAITKNNGKYTVTTVQGGTIVLSLKDGKVVLTDANGGTATVILADVAASNGVIHAIDTVVMPK